MAEAKIGALPSGVNNPVEKAVYASLSQSCEPTAPNEASLLALITMQKFYKDDSKEAAVLKHAAQAEMNYYVEALRLLYPPDGKTNAKTELLRARYPGLSGATKLAELIKQKTDEQLALEIIQPSVKSVKDYRNGSGAGLFGAAE